jgi:hypothetical protein
MNTRAILLVILGSIGLAVGIFAMTPYNQTGPTSYIIYPSAGYALLVCGFGIFFILFGLWVNKKATMNNRAIDILIVGLTGLAIGILGVTSHNESPTSYVLGGLQFALLLCGLGILFVILGIWLARRSK